MSKYGIYDVLCAIYVTNKKQCRNQHHYSASMSAEYTMLARNIYLFNQSPINQKWCRRYKFIHEYKTDI